MWFLPFSVLVTPHRIYTRGHEKWFLRFMEKLLEGDRAVTALLKANPFADAPPQFVRARFFLYQFTSPAERRETGNIWKRTFIDDYLPPISLQPNHGNDDARQTHPALGR